MADPRNLLDCGQSYWLDDLSRDLLVSGELERRVQSEGLRGMTSNPKTFSDAISSGDSYDEQIRELLERRLPVGAIYEALAVTDVQNACDLLRPVFEASDGRDGFVSLEVSPHLAHDTAGTIEEVRRLHAAVDRPNVMIKIPGTLAGLDAIEEMLFEGVHVNVTLLFALERYEAVSDRYLRALERRLDKGLGVERVASVASFFLSRLDVLADELLSHRIAPGSPPPGRGPERLLGAVAVASAKLAYRSYQRTLESERWRALAKEGAAVQRLLWASTSTKNPTYRDVKYVEPLIGRDTVSTMPAKTIAAFADHGVLRCDTIEEGVDEAESALRSLSEHGIDLRSLTWQLENEGVQKFVAPFDELMATLAEKCRRATAVPALRLDLDDFGPRARSGAQALHEMRFAKRLFAKDASLWSRDEQRVDRIRNRLGWLDGPSGFRERSKEIRAFAREAKEAFDHVLLLGMGGSSLFAAAAGEMFPSTPGYPELRVLDSTDPGSVARAQKRLDPSRTLFVVASKSGTTAETLAFFHYFYEMLERRHADRAGDHFVAITDPGSPLAIEAASKRFARVFENPPDVGGRYSALSYFGLVPLALRGVNVERIVSRAEDMLCCSGGLVPEDSDPGFLLGTALGFAARSGRNKVTFDAPGELAGLARWVEQLLAESTGKQGVGLVPVVDEPLASPELYGDDRVFVSMRRAEDPENENLAALERAGHPLVRIVVADPTDLGPEVLKWEIATATAGAVLGVDPFDEPNVRDTKERTREILEEWASRRAFEPETPLVETEQIAIFADPVRNERLSPLAERRALADVLRRFFDLARPGDYTGLLAYLPRLRDRHERFQALRAMLRDRLGIATTLGYGPQYLHSTGQLHKGGPDEGLFVLLTGEPASPIAIPGESYGFDTLNRAQALADFRALNERGRRVLRVHFSKNADDGLEELVSAVESWGGGARRPPDGSD